MSVHMISITHVPSYKVKVLGSDHGPPWERNCFLSLFLLLLIPLDTQTKKEKRRKNVERIVPKSADRYPEP